MFYPPVWLWRRIPTVVPRGYSYSTTWEEPLPGPSCTSQIESESETKIAELEKKLSDLREEYEKYASKASEGFLSLANLVDKIADRIKEIESFTGSTGKF